MTEQRYTVVFEGKLQPGKTRAEVQPRLAKLFNLDPATAELLFSGKPLVKRGLTQQQAQQYQRAFQQAGAQCRVAAEQAGAQPPRPAPTRPAPAVAPTARWAPSSDPPPPPRQPAVPAAVAPPQMAHMPAPPAAPRQAPAGATMQCPKCGRSQPAATECAFCGVVVSKVGAAAAAPSAFDTAPPSPFAVPAPPAPAVAAPAIAASPFAVPAVPAVPAAPAVGAFAAAAAPAAAPGGTGHPRDVVAMYHSRIASDRIFLAPRLPGDQLPDALLPFRSDYASWPNDEAFVLDPEEEILAVMISDIRLRNSVAVLVLTDQKLLHAMSSGAHSCIGFVLTEINSIQITGVDQDRLMVDGRELLISDTSSHDQQSRVELAAMLQAVVAAARSMPPAAFGAQAPAGAVKVGQVRKAYESKGGSSGGGFLAPEKKGLEAGVVGGLIMMAIGIIWFVVAWQAGYIFPWSLVLVVLGLFGTIKGLIQGNWAGQR